MAFQELVRLRNPQVDRILAVGSDAPTSASNLRDTEPISHLLCMCADSAILSMEMFTSKIIARDSGLHAGQANCWME